MNNDKELNDLKKFLRLKDQEIKKQIQLKRNALSQRNWFISVCIMLIIALVASYLNYGI